MHPDSLLIVLPHHPSSYSQPWVAEVTLENPMCALWTYVSARAHRDTQHVSAYALRQLGAGMALRTIADLAASRLTKEVRCHQQLQCNLWCHLELWDVLSCPVKMQ